MKQNLLLLVSSNGLAAKLSDEIHVLHRLIYLPVHSPLGSFDLNYFFSNKYSGDSRATGVFKEKASKKNWVASNHKT